MSRLWFGADPGGADKFGVALLADDGAFETGLVSSVEEALAWLKTRCADLEAAGIDAPLWWSSGRSGDRKSDAWLRRTYRIRSGTVQTVNSLRGAALIQGVMLAWGLRATFPLVPVTEAHPKALLKALGLGSHEWPQTARRFALNGAEPTEDERDALLAAVAARNGSTGAWPLDLSQTRGEFEQDPSAVPWGPVRYWWPALSEA